MEEYVLTKGKFFLKDVSLFKEDKTNMVVKANLFLKHEI